MEHHKADVWQVADRGTAGDDAARFLRELRQLRDGAGLGHAELAARAHYPYDLIKAAEAGPSLPDLPVLSAYVRGCGGTAEEWEERWRRLTRTPSLPVSAARDAGNSAAATAGARIGAVTQVVDAPDPSVIIAALNRVAEGMAVGGPDMDEASLTIPPRPAYPGDYPPADASTAGASAADVSLPDVSLPDVSDVSVPDVSVPGFSLPDVSLADVSLADVFTADPVPDPVIGPADFSPFTPVAPVAPVDDPPVTAADAAATDLLADSLADSPGGAAEPAADDRPKGWDPIRVSAAWPAIGSEDTRGIRVSDDTKPMDTPVRDAPPWGAAEGAAGAVPSGPDAVPPAAQPGASAAAGSGTRRVIRQSAWASGVDASGEPTGVARPGSRARTLLVAVVLVCVLAVVLAIFT